MDKSKYHFTELQSEINSQHSRGEPHDSLPEASHSKPAPYRRTKPHLRLYWSRTLTCIFVPLLITTYYAALWAWWIKRFRDNGPVPRGPAGGRWAYYTWFALSAVGIGMSKYGLTGVEAAMLMDRRWAPHNAMQLMAHSDKTWSGPSGWAFNRVRPSPTWTLLALVSLLPYIALPLSGFTLELTSGYSSKGGDHRAYTVGQTKDTFLDQNLEEVFTRSFDRWRSPAPSVLYGRSAYYIPKEDDSSLDRKWLQSYPNSWPDTNRTTVFIAPQSHDIISGQSWGLESNLTCSIVSSIDQFKLLSQRNYDKTAPRCPPITFNSTGESPEYMGLPDLCDFDVYTLHPPENVSLLYLNELQGIFPVGEMEIAVSYDKSGYSDKDVFSDPEPVIMEVALWQNPIEIISEKCPRLQKQLSNELGTIVEGMTKEFSLNAVSSLLTGQRDLSPKQLSAIGVRCESRWRTGTATIDGASGSYGSFTQEAAKELLSATPVPVPTAVPRIFRSELSAAISLQDMYGVQSLQSMIDDLPVNWSAGSNMDLNPTAWLASNATWLTNIYKSVDAYYRTPLYCGNDPTAVGAWQQLQLINSSQLLTSIIRSYKAYAIEMTKPPADSPFISETLFSMKSTSIIGPGQVPPIAVLVILVLWAILSSTLGVVFGIRPRWSEHLDGFSMFRFGSHYHGLDQDEVAYVKHYSEWATLSSIPGMVGRETSTGRVTLISKHTDGRDSELVFRNSLEHS